MPLPAFVNGSVCRTAGVERMQQQNHRNLVADVVMYRCTYGRLFMTEYLICVNPKRKARPERLFEYAPEPSASMPTRDLDTHAQQACRPPTSLCPLHALFCLSHAFRLHVSQVRTEIVPCEGTNAGQRSAGCDAVGTAAELTVQIKPEYGQSAAAGHDVAGEHEEGSLSRDSKVQLTTSDGKSAAEPTAAERDVR